MPVNDEFRRIAHNQFSCIADLRDVITSRPIRGAHLRGESETLFDWWVPYSDIGDANRLGTFSRILSLPRRCVTIILTFLAIINTLQNAQWKMYGNSISILLLIWRIMNVKKKYNHLVQIKEPLIWHVT